MKNNFLFILIACFFCAYAYSTPRMEGRFIQLQNTYTTPVWTQINFQQAYNAPPAVFMLSTNQGGNPAIIRIRNVTNTGFEALPLEPSGEDGEHITMGAHYFAIEKGVHTFTDGTVAEIGSVQINNLQYGSTNYGNGADFDIARSWYTLNFATSFSQRPTFFHSLQTINNLDSVVPQTALIPFYTIAVESDSLSANSVNIALEASETRKGSSNQTETIAYMAVEPGSNRTFLDDDGNTVTWETFFSGNVIDGWSDGCNNINFNNTYTTTPLVAASKVSRNGTDGGWLRSCRLNANQLGLVVDEDRSWDNERNHGLEEASILAMDKSLFVFSGDLPSCEALFPTPLASFDDSGIRLDKRVTVTSGSSILVAPFLDITAPGVGNQPKCNGATCSASGTNAITASEALAIPSVVNDGSSTSLPSSLSGDYFFDQQQLDFSPGNYTVTAPTRIFLQWSFNDSTKAELLLRTSNITIAPGAYLAIYVDGSVQISPSVELNVLLIATGQVDVGDGAKNLGFITAGDGIIARDNTEFESTPRPGYIPGMCGSESIEVVDHYRFELSDNKGLTCEAKAFKIKACANADCTTLYSQPVSLDLSPNVNTQYTWSPSENISFTGELDLSLASNKVQNNVAVSFNSATPSAQLQCFIGGSLITGDCRVNYADTGFLIKDINGDPLADQVAAVEFKAYLRAVKTNDQTGVCDDIFDGARTVKFDTGYVAPNTASLAAQMRMLINGVTIDGVTDVAVNFDPLNGHKAELTVNYPDAGQITISAEDTVDTGATLKGTSDVFVVRPDRLEFVLEDNHAVTDNSYALNEAGSVFKKTNQDFPITINAVNKDGVITQNFHSSELSAGALSFNHTLVYPTTGVSGVVTPDESGVSFSNGVASFNAKWSEVGILGLDIAVASTGYLTHSEGFSGQISNIGRFVPAAFYLVPPVELPPMCDSFTYLAQPFKAKYTIRALSDEADNGIVTQNYFGPLAKANLVMKLENNEPTAKYKSFDNFVDSNSVSRLIDRTSLGTWSAGLYALDNSQFQLKRDTAVDGPFKAVQFVLEVTDGESSPFTLLKGLNEDPHTNNLALACNAASPATCTGVKLNTSLMEFRYGRLVLEDTYGSAFSPIQIPLKTEYWDDTQWKLNTLDNCSEYQQSLTQLSPASPALTFSLQGMSPYVLQAGKYQTGQGIEVNPLSQEQDGVFFIEYTNPEAWLQYDWLGDNSLLNPRSQIQFGRYRGNDRVIYWRESN